MISVIIPVFNTANLLDRCLQSVVDQGFDDWEGLLIDDGSTDGSSLICDDWSLRDSHFKVIHQPNQGVSFARNVGIDLSRGDWIYFLDSDDYCVDIPIPDPDMDLILGNYRCESSLIRSRRCPDAAFDNYALSFLREDIRCCVGSYLVRKRLLDDHSLRFTTGCLYGEDLEFHFKLFLFSKGVQFSDHCFCCYQQSPSSATRRLTTKRFDVFYSRLRQIEAARENNNTEALKYLEDYSLIEAVVEPAKALLRGGMKANVLSAFLKSDHHIAGVLASAPSSEKTADKFKRPAWLLLHCPAAYKIILVGQDAKYNLRAWLGRLKRNLTWTA